MTAEARSLNLDMIVDAAIVVAEKRGVGAVSMRNVGNELGFSAMSLYRHVDNKDALLDLIADRVIGEVPDIGTGAGWSEVVVEFFTSLYRVVLKHHALAGIFTLRPTTGPQAQRHSRQVLAVLTDDGLAPDKAVELYIALACYTLGSALYAAGRANADGPERAWMGLGGDDLGAEALSRLAHRADSDQFRSGLDHLVRGFAADL